MIKALIICTCLLLTGIAGIIVICNIPMSHLLGAAIGFFSSVLTIAGGVGLMAILDGHADDDDGPHFYGPGGTIV